MPDLDSPSPSTVRLTAVHPQKAQSAGSQLKDPLTPQSLHGHVDETAQVQHWSRDRPIRLSTVMGRGKQIPEEEEQEALLANIDGEEDTLSSSHRPSLYSAEASSHSTPAESYQVNTEDGIDADSETARGAPQSVAPDQFVEGYETTKWEVWAYYGYYIGNTGLTLTIFAPMAMQNLMSLAAGEKGTLPFFRR